MAQATAPALLRLTLRGPTGCADLAVGPGVTPAELLNWLADGRGGGVRPAVVCATSTGRVLEPGASLRSQGVDDGDVLVALPSGTAGGSTERGEQPAGRRSGNEPLRRETLGAGVSLLAAAALVAALTPHGPARSLTALVLLLTAAVTAVTSVALVAPAFAAAGGYLLVAGPQPGADRLALVAAGVAAVQAAALGRLTRRGEEGQLVWLVAGSLVAVVSGAALLAGAPAGTAWAAWAGCCLPVVRLLPSLAVEDLVLDVDGRPVVAGVGPGPVGEVVERGQRRLRAGTVATGVLAAATVPALLHDPGDDVARWGAWVLAGCVGAGLSLGARDHRRRLPKVALRLGGATALITLACAVLPGLDTAWLVVVVAVSGLTASLVIVAAVALGRGWRFLRWGRCADIVETTAAALCLPAALVAAGGFEYVRQLAA